MVIITRSLIPLLRTTQFAVRQPRGVNPLQQVFNKSVNGSKGLATVFERSKPHVNIGMIKFLMNALGVGLIRAGTIGHVDHGKVPASSNHNL